MKAKHSADLWLAPDTLELYAVDYIANKATITHNELLNMTWNISYRPHKTHKLFLIFIEMQNKQ